jgi:hypothetical protein
LLSFSKTGDIFQIERVCKGRADLELKILAISDCHFDSPHCKRRMLKSHLDQAMIEGAAIIDLGDFFDVMQGRHDPRRADSDLKTDYRGGKYVNRLLDDATEFLRPYAGNIAMMGEGNHETAFRKNNSICLTTELISRLNQMGGNVQHGGYTGHIRLRIRRAGSSGSLSCLIAWDHGRGGASPVTKGVIQHQRRAIMFPQAHAVLSGHVHEMSHVVHVGTTINENGRAVSRAQHHIGIPGYKEEWGDGRAGWAVEKLGPKPLGGCWVTASERRDPDRLIIRHQFAD